MVTAAADFLGANEEKEEEKGDGREGAGVEGFVRSAAAAAAAAASALFK